MACIQISIAVHVSVNACVVQVDESTVTPTVLEFNSAQMEFYITKLFTGSSGAQGILFYFILITRPLITV